MHSPKLRPPTIKQEDEGSCRTIRWCLLVWAILRLIVSVLWTGTIMLGAIGYLSQIEPQETTSSNNDHHRDRLWLYIYSILVQLVEFGMLVTFITAGVKKSARLYRAYYRYCILTLIIYIIAVLLCFIFEYYGLANHFIEVYLTYHIDEFPIIENLKFFYIGFFLAAIIDIGLEILLIISTNKLIKKYSLTSSESV